MNNITFEQYKIDLLSLICKRILSQFNVSKDGIIRYLNALVEQTQDWNTITQTVFSGRFLELARGVNLDIIGKIVGFKRPFVDGSEIPYFKYDSEDPKIGYDGIAGWFVTNAPIADQVPIGDSLYRNFIKGKIFKNQVTGASVPELIQFIKIVFNIDSSVENNNDELLSINILVPLGTIQFIKDWLASKKSNDSVENDYFVPLPICVTIRDVLEIP